MLQIIYIYYIILFIYYITLLPFYVGNLSTWEFGDSQWSQKKTPAHIIGYYLKHIEINHIEFFNRMQDQNWIFLPFFFLGFKCGIHLGCYFISACLWQGSSVPIKGSGPNHFLRGCSLVTLDLALIMSHKPGFPVWLLVGGYKRIFILFFYLYYLSAV